MDLLSAIRRTVEQQSKVGSQAARQRVAQKALPCNSAETTPTSRSKTTSATEGENMKLSGRTLSEASEDELLAELVQRRQMSRRLGRHGVIKLGQTRNVRETPILTWNFRKMSRCSTSFAQRTGASQRLSSFVTSVNLEMNALIMHAVCLCLLLFSLSPFQEYRRCQCCWSLLAADPALQTLH